MSSKVLRKVEEARPKALIEEIILENFMSYEYARIPLKAGLNLVCGPNGAGKSSILLALSVALGQAHTERSRRLSDLVRRGEETARITILFDNRPVKGRRPIPSSTSDTFRLTRYLRRDGTYWFEADYRHVAKADVVRLLSSFGVNPDNMLIIMHQGMVEQFTLIPPEQRLQLVEEAVGLHPYRQRVLEAQTRLEGLLSEEKSVGKLLREAEENLAYWKTQHERYQRKLQLAEQRRRLEVELAWAHVSKLEAQLERMVEEAERLKRRLDKTFAKLEEARVFKRKTFEDFEKVKAALKSQSFELLRVEVERAEGEGWLKLAGKLEVLPESLKAQAEEFREKVKALASKALKVREALTNLEAELDGVRDRLVEAGASEKLLEYQFKELESELKRLYREMEKVREDLEIARVEAEKAGPRVYTDRSPQEVAEELKTVNIHLSTLSDVSGRVEKLYEKFRSLYEELKGKIVVLEENKRKLLEEIDVRREVWVRRLEEVLSKVNQSYQRLLSTIGARGEVRLVNPQSFEKAGLELTVGFHGAPPVKLDAYTQSGGERSTTIMAFLLALQEHVASPIRAVDEFDVHMDPKNREAVARLIVETVRENPETQYIVITPWHHPIFDEEARVIVVQKVGGKSEVAVVEGEARSG
ncbi:MAG: hypothetical protein DRO52_01010 [Candidatus Hecatellales archaeon]|nr:MAG: hypothetical protein DRO52_01010 [Candidatus Hecatellales archaeon]